VRRRDARQLEEQFVILSGCRAQLLGIRLLEAFGPCVVGGAIALALLRALTEQRLRQDDAPDALQRPHKTVARRAERARPPVRPRVRARARARAPRVDRHRAPALPPRAPARADSGGDCRASLRLLGAYGRDERRRVAELIRAAGLGERASARPAELSGGEQQRVAICAALAKRPRLLLADEPTGELDARSTTTVIDLLLELTTATGAAALIVTHDMQVALRTSRTIHIRDGRLAAEGTARPVLIVDEHGWLRIPRRLRETAGVRDRVRASAA
jgi:ABC-type dipeptide/oligopeptide/nickel transport system ATPase component